MIRYPQAYIDYLVYFHTERDFFECHEVLEDYWKHTPNNIFSPIWLGLIQIAVGLYHHRRGNVRGAGKMLNSSLANLSPGLLNQLGLDGDQVIHSVTNRTLQLQKYSQLSYEDINLPIQDPKLLQKCHKICEDRNLTWLQVSNLFNDQLVHKHKLRDRSGVINERKRQLTQKSIARNSSGG